MFNSEMALAICSNYALPPRLQKITGTENFVQYERWKKSKNPFWMDFYNEILGGLETGYRHIQIENDLLHLNATVAVKDGKLKVVVYHLALTQLTREGPEVLKLRSRASQGTLTLPYLIAVFESAIRQTVLNHPEISLIQITAKTVANTLLREELTQLGFSKVPFAKSTYPYIFFGMFAAQGGWLFFSRYLNTYPDPNANTSGSPLSAAIAVDITAILKTGALWTFGPDFRLVIPVSSSRMQDAEDLPSY